MRRALAVIKEIIEAFGLFFSNLWFVIKLHYKKAPPVKLDHDKPPKAKFAVLDNNIYEKSHGDDDDVSGH
jgi:hypothetical protein